MMTSSGESVSTCKQGSRGSGKEELWLDGRKGEKGG